LIKLPRAEAKRTKHRGSLLPSIRLARRRRLVGLGLIPEPPSHVSNDLAQLIEADCSPCHIRDAEAAAAALEVGKCTRRGRGIQRLRHCKQRYERLLVRARAAQPEPQGCQAEGGLCPRGGSGCSLAEDHFGAEAAASAIKCAQRLPHLLNLRLGLSASEHARTQVIARHTSKSVDVDGGEDHRRLHFGSQGRVRGACVLSERGRRPSTRTNLVELLAVASEEHPATQPKRSCAPPR
jgi:hypothetical protein